MITPEQLAAKGTEGSQQQALFCWIAQAKRTYPQLACVFAIPNGGFRNPREAASLVSQGVRAGVPDIFAAFPSRNCHGLFIEMKVGKNITSDSQDDWAIRLLQQGYYVITCYTYENARDVILWYLGVIDEQTATALPAH